MKQNGDDVTSNVIITEKSRIDSNGAQVSDNFGQDKEYSKGPNKRVYTGIYF